MNNEKNPASNIVWVAVVAAFLLVFGSVWYASSLGSRKSAHRARTMVAEKSTPSSSASSPDIGTDSGLGVPALPPPDIPLSDPIVQITPMKPLKPIPKKAENHKISVKDMFPMGDITRDQPIVEHPYRTMAELFPSFEYNGKLWSATGKYLLAGQADLTPTGFSLRTGQMLFALANTAAPDSVLFVRSRQDPEKYAIYRATM
ncbi:MAG: hypothetical protein ACOX3G_07885 [Armatimonadota bacterium]|jgi:hypothetical protein